MTAFFSWQHAIRSSKLESTTKLVCYTIWSHMASDGTGCFPSYALIAEESGLSRRCVIEHVDKAEKAGFLTVDARQRENGSASSNVYRPTMPGGDRDALGGDPSSLGGGDPAAPPENTTLSNNPSNSSPVVPKTKASSRALPVRSIAVILEDLAEIPADLGDRAVAVYGLSIEAIIDEWAKFRNYHISNRSKHTRVDLCWDTWCRNAAKFARERKAPAGGTTGQGGFKRHDHVASAVNTAMVSLYGVGYEGHGGQAAQPANEACPFGDGPEAIDAVFVDAGAGDAAGAQQPLGLDGSDPDSVGGGALPLEVQRG